MNLSVPLVSSCGVSRGSARPCWISSDLSPVSPGACCRHTCDVPRSLSFRLAEFLVGVRVHVGSRRTSHLCRRGLAVVMPVTCLCAS